MCYTWQGNFKHYFGLGCIKRFAIDLLEIETENNFKHNEKMIFTEEDKLYHETNNTCHICSKTCINKVKDHCHETGKYRGPACKICNLRYKQQNFIPVIFHNGSGYDFNLLYSELFKQNNDKRKVDNIPLAAGKSKMFSIGCLKFLYSYNFLAMPLDQMAKIYGCKTKTLYPYEYFGLELYSSKATYQEAIGNLKIEDFKSSLHNKLRTQEEVYNFNNEDSHKTGKDLTIEYLQNDVEILDYCTNEYVKLSMKEFKLNPLHYVSLPGYSFDCWLMSSGVTLDALQDKQMLDDFVGAKRGGIFGIMGDRYINISNTNSNANIRDKTNTNTNTSTNTNTNTNDKIINRNIWYIDANNLYGFAMMQNLHNKDFEFTTTTTLDPRTDFVRGKPSGFLDVILNAPDDSDHGYYIVCDIDYTNECKERTEQLALKPNKRKINDNELGYLRSSFTDQERDGVKARSEKLILDHNNKTEYMVHYRMLKFYVKMGVKVTKKHRVIKFKQDYICSDYIQNNTNKRATAKTEAEKDVMKLMNNSLYGRMCMNPLHFFQSKFLHDEEKIMKSVSKPTFKNITRYRDYSQIEYIKKKIEYDSPVYVGVTILELSKLHMYDVFFNILQPSLKDLTLHYMNTDCFVLSYSEGKVSDEPMDLSNLEVPIKTKNKVPGKFKHELGSRIIEEFIALSPKTYSFKNYPKNAKEKGIKKHNNARHIDYYDALTNNTQRTVDECRKQKVGDNMTTTKTSKISLNTFDDKRFYVNNIKSYPHDENLYLFKRDLIKMIRQGSLDGDKDLLVNNILELTINDDRKLIEVAIILYNELC